MPEYMGLQFPTLPAMVEAVAIESITHSGRRPLDSDDVRQDLATSRAWTLAAECIQEFHLEGHMQVEGYTQADLAGAFKALAQGIHNPVWWRTF